MENDQFFSTYTNKEISINYNYHIIPKVYEDPPIPNLWARNLLLYISRGAIFGIKRRVSLGIPLGERMEKLFLWLRTK
jgi:hypothetical protein